MMSLMALVRWAPRRSLRGRRVRPPPPPRKVDMKEARPASLNAHGEATIVVERNDAFSPIPR
jgi:hypothetical protein